MDKNDNQRLNSAFNIIKQFEDDFSRTRSYNHTYSELMRKLMMEQAVDYYGKPMIVDNKYLFNEVTGLGYSTFYRINRDASYIPSLATFVTLCMVYKLDISMAITLRETMGLIFSRTNRLHQAYCYLLVNCRGRSLSYCNKVLQSLSIEEKYFLGDKTIDELELLNEISP